MHPQIRTQNHNNLYHPRRISMTAILNSIKALFNKCESTLIDKPKNAATNNINQNTTDKKTQSVASTQFKAKALNFLESIKDREERDNLKNAYNVLRCIINAESTKTKLKAKDVAVAVEYCVKRSEKGQLREDESKEIADFFDKIS